MHSVVNTSCALLVSMLIFLASAIPTTTAAPVDYKTLSPFAPETVDTDILWNQINAVQGGSITFVKKIEGKLYFGTQYGKLYSSDGFGQEKTIVSPDKINGMTDLLFNENVFFIGTGEGIYLSKDNLVTWTLVNNPDLAKADIFKIIVHNNALFTATSEGIFTSGDNGANWKKLNIVQTDPYYFPSYFIVSNGSTLLAANINTQAPESPLIFSRDNGATWQTAIGSFFVGSQSRQPVTVINGRFYVAGLSYAYSNPEDHVSILSSSDGENWSQGSALEMLGSSPAISHMTHDATGRIYVTNDPYTETAFTTLFSPVAVTGHPDETDWKIFDEPERPVTSLSVVDDQLVMGILHEGSLKSYNPDTDEVKKIDAVNSVYASALAGSNGHLQLVAAGAAPNPLQDAFFNYVTCDSNVYLYSDGEKWVTSNPEKITSGPLNTIGWNTAKDVETTPKISVTVTCTGKLFYSEDGGHTTVEVKTDILPTSAGATVSLFNGKIYASNQRGIYEVSAFISNKPVLKEVKKFDARTDVLKDFLATEKILYAVSMNLGPLMSLDGETWLYLNKGLNNAKDVQAVAFGNKTVFGAGNGVFRLIAGSDAWEDISGNLSQIIGNSTVNDIEVYDDTLIITVTDYGVLLGFTDGRTTWKESNAGLHTKRINRVIKFGSNVIAGSMEDGFYNGTFINNFPDR